MEEKNNPEHFLFVYKDNYVRISKREEQNLLNLLQQYGSVKNVPASELISVCRIRMVKEKFTDSENYSFIPVKDLTPFNESLSEKRRTGFLKFSKAKRDAKSVK